MKDDLKFLLIFCTLMFWIGFVPILGMYLEKIYAPSFVVVMHCVEIWLVGLCIIGLFCFLSQLMDVNKGDW